jgi:hypothetical protein
MVTIVPDCILLEVPKWLYAPLPLRAVGITASVHYACARYNERITLGLCSELIFASTVFAVALRHRRVKTVVPNEYIMHVQGLKTSFDAPPYCFFNLIISTVAVDNYIIADMFHRFTS